MTPAAGATPGFSDALARTRIYRAAIERLNARIEIGRRAPRGGERPSEGAIRRSALQRDRDDLALARELLAEGRAAAARLADGEEVALAGLPDVPSFVLVLARPVEDACNEELVHLTDEIAERVRILAPVYYDRATRGYYVRALDVGPLSEGGPR